GEEPVSIQALKTARDGVDGSLTAVLKYRSGAICAVDGGFDAQSALVSEICGTKGSLLIRDTFADTGTPILLTRDGVTEEVPVEPCSRYVLQMEDFADAILNRRAPGFALAETIRNCGIIERILQTAKE
ncbi:MAG TPA: gfo/Idh/MocA family oxidoreductase, partial [Candidatus Limnocylindria bacterium]|nr:gfo/Idh/MocA family oxidoreductase [Candidatus Limnocylindria bacterium]